MYFIEAIGANLVKIGFTDRPIEDRLRELQTASPHQLRVLAIAEGDLKTESSYHERFSHLRETGEWFKLDSEIRMACVCIYIIRPFLNDLKDIKTEINRSSYEIDAIHSSISADDLDNRVSRIEAELGRIGAVFHNDQTER